jgi:hypothetical protein
VTDAGTENDLIERLGMSFGRILVTISRAGR